MKDSSSPWRDVWHPIEVSKPTSEDNYLVTIEITVGSVKTSYVDLLYYDLYSWNKLGKNRKVVAWMQRPRVYVNPVSESIELPGPEGAVYEQESCSSDSSKIYFRDSRYNR